VNIPGISAYHGDLPSCFVRGGRLVCTFNVLEHIENESGILKEIFRAVRNRGYFFMIVPAFDFLWSAHDVSLGHERRYVKNELIKKLRSAGFTSSKMNYFNSLLFPLAVSFRALRKSLNRNDKKVQSEFSFVLPKIVNELFYKIFSSESRLLNYSNLPVGLSLISVCKIEKNHENKRHNTCF